MIGRCDSAYRASRWARAAAASATDSCPEVIKRFSANAPTAAPMSVGHTHVADASGLVSAAAMPSAANTVKPAKPSHSRHVASTPISMAYRKTMMRMPPTSTFLSSWPNVATVQSLSQSGVEPIAASPTATTGDAAGIESPAINCAMPIAAAAANKPHTAPHPRESPVLGVMHVWSVVVSSRYASTGFRRPRIQPRYLAGGARDRSG